MSADRGIKSPSLNDRERDTHRLVADISVGGAAATGTIDIPGLACVSLAAETFTLSNFGVFVELESDLEGLLHISGLADHKVDNPEEIVKVGEDIEVKIMRVDQDERKIALSRKRVEWAEEAEDETSEASSPKAPKSDVDLKGGLGGGNSGKLIETPKPAAAPEAKAEPAPAAEAASETDAGPVPDSNAETEDEPATETEAEEKPTEE